MRKRFGLCVGNNYPGTHAELNGCVNDALDWTDLLREQGYEVTLMTEATRAETLAELERLVALAGWGDRVVFTFSGHGSWVLDRSGDEADGRDEVLVMADYMQGGLLSDDDLQRTFAALRPGAGALILSDSCHSGTVSRFLGDEASAKPRWLSPANFTDLTDLRVVEIEARGPASAPRKTASLISGCHDLEYSWDAWFDGRANGAFSYWALRVYQPWMSLAQWYRAIREMLPDDDFPQSPQLTTQNEYRRYLAAL